jgi:thiol-disulfide isomerase/thioredoxin
MLSRLATFQLMIEALMTGESDDPAPVVQEIKALMAGEKVDDQVFWLSRDAAMIFQRLGHEQEAIDILKTVGERFQDSDKEDVAAAAAGMLEQAKMVELQPFLYAVIEGQEGAEARFLEQVDGIFAAGTPTVTAYQMLVQVAEMMEQGGMIDPARALFKKLQTVYANHENKQLADLVAKRTDKALGRLALIGQPFLVEGVNLEGEKFDWNAYRGRVVLVDFWASWCEPCIREMPNIERSYEKFRDKGFAVVGVNLDDTRKAARSFLAGRPLPWTTVVAADETQQGPRADPNAVRYGVDAIPFMVLVDQEGKVVALHVRGPQLEQYLVELLGPASVGEKVEPTTPDKPPASEQPDLEPRRLDDTGRADRATVHYCSLAVDGDDPQAADDPDAEATDDAEPEPAEINPYSADEGLSSFELVEFLEDMKEKPRVIQSRPGFTEAVTEAADRILAAGASDKFKEIAALTKLEYLHKDACLGDESADEQLMACVAELKNNQREKIAAEVEFLLLERRAVEADQLEHDEIVNLLADLKEYFTDRKLAAKHLRIASGTVRAINQLEDENQREARFAEFGKIFAASEDRTLAAYGKKLSQKQGEPKLQVVGQTLEISGVTVDGTAFDWTLYRGNHVLVHFWATWCPACVRAMPQIAQLREKYGDKGLEVVGVCMDQDLDKLAAYLEKNDTPWTHLAGQRCRETATKYGVRGIPSLMLVDGEAKILAVSHNPDEIAERLATLLDKPK